MNKQNKKLLWVSNTFVFISFTGAVALVGIVAGVAIHYGLEKRYEKSHQEHIKVMNTTPADNIYDLESINNR